MLVVASKKPRFTRVAGSAGLFRSGQRIARIVLLAPLIWLSGCAGSGQFVAPKAPPADNRTIRPPKPRHINPQAEYFNKTVTRQLKEILDLSRDVRILTGNRKEAFNVDAFDQVFNSSWFTNRHHLNPMSAEEIARGPDLGSGPDTQNTWTITKAKSQGVTPGFHIKDSRGDRYVVKFDPKGYAELASGAEVVSTKLFHAMGYNTPENFIVYFDPSILHLGDDVEFTDDKGERRKMNEADLQKLFEKVEFLPDGRIRAMASKYLSGKPIGPFKYAGTRGDDPNDIIPHQHRRELRGLRVIAAWLNHFDTKDGNSLDVYLNENERSYVKHFLIDFGATLGSASWGPNTLYRGYENDLDLNVMFANMITLGLHVRQWEKQTPQIFPSIGLYEAELFDPHGYKPQIPNPAFENMTALDSYWAAKVVTSFTDDILAVAVRQGQYSDPQAEAYLLSVLKARRDEIGRTYLPKVNCLDRFAISRDSNGNPVLTFVDVMVEAGLAVAEESVYQAEIRYADKALPGSNSIGSNHSVVLPTSPPPGSSISPDNQWEISLRLKRDGGDWGKWVKVYLIQSHEGIYKLIGLRRES